MFSLEDRKVSFTPTRKFNNFPKRIARISAIVLLTSVAILSSLAPAQAAVPITQFVPTYGSSLPFAAVAGAALTLGATISFQGTAGSVQSGDASASNQYRDGFAVKLALDALGSPTAMAPGLSGQTITPGVYFSGAALTMNTDLNLDAQGDTGAVFVILTPGAMTVAASAKMHLLGGAQAANVFWSIGGAILAGADSALLGHFYTDTVIGVGARTQVSGQLFAKAALSLGADSSVTNDLAIPRPTISWLNHSMPPAAKDISYGAHLTVAKTSTPSTPETSATYAIDSGALPDGLLLNSATGSIAGIPTSSGTYNFGIDAHLFGHTPISTTFSFVVLTVPAPIPPTPPAPPTDSGNSGTTPTGTHQSDSIPAATTPLSSNPLPSTLPSPSVSISPTITEVNRFGTAVIAHADLTRSDVWSLAPSYFRRLNSEEFRLISPHAITGLHGAQIRALAPSTLSKMTARQFNILKRAQVLVLSGKQLNALSKTTLFSASSKQIHSLRKAAIFALTPKSLSELNSQAIWSIPNSIFRAMSTSQQHAMKVASGRTLVQTKAKVTAPSEVTSCVGQAIQASSPWKSQPTVQARQRPIATCKQSIEA